jgi:hypothetical protein
MFEQTRQRCLTNKSKKIDTKVSFPLPLFSCNIIQIVMLIDPLSKQNGNPKDGEDIFDGNSGKIHGTKNHKNFLMMLL